MINANPPTKIRNAAAPQVGVKRTSNEAGVEAPDRIASSRPGRNSNTHIPYARVVRHDENYNQQVGSMTVGDLLFVGKDGETEIGSAYSRISHVASLRWINDQFERLPMIPKYYEAAGVDTVDKLKQNLLKVHPLLKTWRLDGVIINDDAKEAATNSLGTSHLLFNISTYGVTVVNNGIRETEVDKKFDPWSHSGFVSQAQRLEVMCRFSGNIARILGIVLAGDRVLDIGQDRQCAGPVRVDECGFRLGNDQDVAFVDRLPSLQA